MTRLYTTTGASIPAWTTTGMRVWGGPGTPTEYPDLPDLIPGGERVAPYTLPTQAPWTPMTYEQACPIPDGFGGNAVVHPSVVDMVRETGEPFRGWRYWMAYTPYPGSDDTKENPSIAVSNHGWEWQTPEGVPIPLVPQPDSWYYSDTDLLWDPGQSAFVLYWRHQAHGQRAAISSNGVDWARKGIILPDDHVSLAVIRRSAGDWWMFMVHPNTFQLKFYRASAPLGPWTGETLITLPGAGSNLWHMDMHWDPDLGAFLMIASNRSWYGFGAASRDGSNWSVGPKLFNWGTTYRATMTPSDDPNYFNAWISGQAGGDWSVAYTQLPRSYWADLL